MPTQFSALFAADSVRASSRIARLKAQRSKALDRGVGEWTDEDVAELELAERELHECMAKVARETLLPCLDSYYRPRCPERPGRFPLGDDAIINHLKAAKKALEKSTRGEKAIRARADLKQWAEHKKAVQRAEALGASRCKALFTYWRHAEGADDKPTAETIRAFLQRNWGHDGPIPVDIETAARTLARRRDIISDRVMLGDEPKAEAPSGPVQLCATDVL